MGKLHIIRNKKWFYSLVFLATTLLVYSGCKSLIPISATQKNEPVLEVTHNNSNTVCKPSTSIFSTDNFLPREVCMGRDSATLTIYIIGSFSIFSAYFSIPILLMRFRSKLKTIFPMTIGVPFLLASLFIFSCGAGHLLDIILVKYPVYRLSALWTCFTGVCSWIFFIYVVRYLKEFTISRDKNDTEDNNKDNSS